MKIRSIISLRDLGGDTSESDAVKYCNKVKELLQAEFPSCEIAIELSISGFSEILITDMADDAESIKEAVKETINRAWEEQGFLS